VLATLLNNLKVQERQNRVCTTVAIAIVAETCSPFTVLPGLMNEYRVPELNVQNGVLKSLSFMFEYIGEMGKDYVYAVAPLLEDALMDRRVSLLLRLLPPLPSNRHHRSSGDCLEGNRSLDWVLSHWAHFTVLRFIFVYVCKCMYFLYECTLHDCVVIVTW